MLEMLLVPLLALGLIAIPIANDLDDVDDVAPDDDGLLPETPITDAPSEDETPVLDAAEAVSMETDGVITSPDVTETENAGVFAVAGSSQDDTITVAQTEDRYEITPGAGADVITIGLNSDVSMGDPVFGDLVETRPNLAGDAVPDIIFEETDTEDIDADEVTLQVTQAGIDNLPAGSRPGSQIDVSDTDDAVVIEVDPSVEGNLHLIQVESGAGGGATDFISRYTLVLLAGPDVMGLTAAQAQAIAEGVDTDVDVERLALLDQGTRFTEFDGSTLSRLDDLNEEPMIASNREILSVTSAVLAG
ncbi:hypothetical protein Z945_3228 [Sulfitobacter noctilucae]|uniref:hypothetical protein n=1 Tax=Sulfitobacter noctilucae TaxID=1342302 RepID=UPI00046816AB|nr:hypothetical protein [Sulfitobacter noctilucae]KIN70764.1 hypothetical protein Z945_3228 [Sulfitobacter noctilucae]